MSDYISREAVNQIIAAQCGECADACLEFDGIQPDCNQCLLHGAAKAIKDLPAADVRPVVLCRDCIHFQQFRSHDGFCKIDGMLWNNDFFCANGKKEEN